MKQFLDIILIKEVVAPILIILISTLIYLIIKNVINRVFKIRNKYVDIKKSQTINSLINNLVIRHKITMSIRTYLNSLDFIEIERKGMIYVVKVTEKVYERKNDEKE